MAVSLREAQLERRVGLSREYSVVGVMQTLKFFGIRVIYISQGIDSESEQADALVAVHGLIDSMYLKELARRSKED